MLIVGTALEGAANKAHEERREKEMLPGGKFAGCCFTHVRSLFINRRYRLVASSLNEAKLQERETPPGDSPGGFFVDRG